MTKTRLIAGVVLLLLAAPVLAVTPVTIAHTSQADFAGAEVKNVVVWSLGELTLGRATETILKSHPDVEAISALAVMESGEAIVGTATKGLVLRIGRDGKVSELADLDSVMVTALVVDGSVVYASTAGGSAGVYRIDTRGDKPKSKRIWNDDQAASIWGLARLGTTLVAATAPHGKVYAIEPDGSAEVIFTAKQAVLRSIATSGKAVFVGTGEDGLVYRLEKSGGTWASRVLLDADENEIVSLAPGGDGALYVAASNAGSAGPAAASESDSGRPATGSGPAKPSAKEAPEPENAPASKPAASSPAQESADEDDSSSGPTPEPPAADKPNDNGKAAPHAAAPSAAAPATRPADSAAARRPAARRGGAGNGARGNTVYRISADGIVKVVVRQSQNIGDMIWSGDKLYLATGGEEGAIQEISPETGAWGTLAKFEPHQVTILAEGRDGTLWAGTADAASVIRVEGRLAETGTLISTVMDGEQIARWSSLDLQCDCPDGTAVTVATRTGNVSEPSEGTWSDWSSEIPCGHPWAQLDSPPGRFCQYRLTLKRPKAAGREVTPVVDAVQVVNQVVNLPPEVESVSSEAVDRTKVPQAAKEAGPLRYRQIKIKAADGNKDELRYTIYYRQRASEVWLKADANVDKPLYTWDTLSVPDGVYEIKVEVSDEPGNAPAAALKHSWISRPVVVDNTPPVITELAARPDGAMILLTIAATDASRIAGVEYVLDSAEEPVIMAAADGIFDSPAEKSAATIKDAARGPHVITVKVHDELGNAAYQAVFVNVPEGKGQK